MSERMEKEMLKSDKKAPVKDRFPRIVIIIILAEFCERFSYSGLRVFLTLFLRSKLGFSDQDATEAYHVFCTFVFIFPIIGGIIADNFLGKFRTILYMLFVYAAGNILLALTAIPLLALPGRLCTIIALFLITVGTGGIKPCVTSFGGDQFKLPEQEHYLDIYFNILYFTLCIGSLLAKTTTPILRAEVHCFGEKDCYSLAFGAPTVIILVSIVIFVSAKNKYLIKKPEGNIVLEFVKCITLGIKNRLFNWNRDRDSHWLDSTRHEYDPRFIRDIKKMLSILTIFAVVPMFWALLDQLGSRWTLQATRMDGRFGLVTIKADQMLVIYPIFILCLILISNKYIYPYLEKRKLLQNPLHKMAAGGFLIAISFILSAIVEIYLKTTYPLLPQSGGSQLRLFNGNPCSMAVYDEQHHVTTIPSLLHYSKKDFKVNGFKNMTWRLEGDCFETRNQTILLEEKSAISYFLTETGFNRFHDTVDKSNSGLPIVTFLVSVGNATNMTFYNDAMKVIETPLNDGVSKRVEVFASTYSIRIGDEIKRHNIELQNGAVYKIIINNNADFMSDIVVVTAPNSITMAWLLPQFLIIAMGEVLFSITGSEFAFKEAPESMKAVMTSIWLLTEAFGNVIIIVITRLLSDYRQETQSFIFSGMLLSTLGVFLYLVRGYQFGIDEKVETGLKSESGAGYLQVNQTEE